MLTQDIGRRRREGKQGVTWKQTWKHLPQGQALLNFLEKIGMKLVQRFKIREYETFQSFGHGVLFANCALKPLEIKRDNLDVQMVIVCIAGGPSTFPWDSGYFRTGWRQALLLPSSLHLLTIALSNGSLWLVQTRADVFN